IYRYSELFVSPVPEIDPYWLRSKVTKKFFDNLQALCDEARFWGAFGFYAVLTLVYLVAGLTRGFLTFLISAFMLPAW
ncbi:hypothetical protein HN51_066109, partial [Arachis hypogaea]